MDSCAKSAASPVGSGLDLSYSRFNARDLVVGTGNKLPAGPLRWPWYAVTIGRVRILPPPSPGKSARVESTIAIHPRAVRVADDVEAAHAAGSTTLARSSARYSVL